MKNALAGPLLKWVSGDLIFQAHKKFCKVACAGFVWETNQNLNHSSFLFSELQKNVFWSVPHTQTLLVF